MKPKKLSQIEEQKIMNRFNSAFEALQPYTLEELKDIWLHTKMSSTDRAAIQEAVTIKLRM